MLGRFLEGNYDVDVAATVDEALTLLHPANPHAVVISDQRMPMMTGVEFLASCARRSPLTVRILMTGDSNRLTPIDAINRGHVYHFLNKPIDPSTLLATLDTAVRQHELLMAEHRVLDSTLRSCVNMLLEVISAADPATFELSQRLCRTVQVFAKAMHLPNFWELEMAAALARLGTSTLPRSVLAKIAAMDPLTPIEQAVLDRVPEVGSNLLRSVPRLETVADAVLYQANAFEGPGTPAAPATRDRIPLGGRILKIFFERALLERDGIARADARRVMEGRTGAYDPTLLAASFECFPHYILSGESASAEIRLVRGAELEAGHMLVADIATHDGALLVAAGTRLSALMIERIRTHVKLHDTDGPFCVQSTAPESGSGFTVTPFAQTPAQPHMAVSA